MLFPELIVARIGHTAQKLSLVLDKQPPLMIHALCYRANGDWKDSQRGATSADRS